MTGNGIESDFVLPDSLFISDYSTLPSFYPHFGANCRFFCTISMSPDSSALFCSPNAARGAASGLRQRVFDPLDSRSRDSVERIFTLCPRANWVSKRAAPASSCFVKGVFTFFIHGIELLCFPPHKPIRTRLLYMMRDSSRVLIRSNSLLPESAFLPRLEYSSASFQSTVRM